jgi:hypothetical protein
MGKHRPRLSCTLRRQPSAFSVSQGKDDRRFFALALVAPNLTKQAERLATVGVPAPHGTAEAADTLDLDVHPIGVTKRQGVGNLDPRCFENHHPGQERILAAEPGCQFLQSPRKPNGGGGLGKNRLISSHDAAPDLQGAWVPILILRDEAEIGRAHV